MKAKMATASEGNSPPEPLPGLCMVVPLPLRSTTSSATVEYYNYRGRWGRPKSEGAQWRIQDGAFGANAPLPPPPPPFKKLHTRSRYSNRAVNYSNKAVTMFMRQCSLPIILHNRRDIVGKDN